MNNKLTNLCIWALLLTGCLLSGCQKNRSQNGPGTSTNQATQPTVVAVAYPLYYLTKRICGDAVEVDYPVPSGMAGDEWRPTRDDISKMQLADLIVINGRGAKYAKWMNTVAIPDSKICATATDGMSIRDYIGIEDIEFVHSHGPEGEHSHSVSMVAQTWLNPLIAKKQAFFISQQLAKTFPDLKVTFDANFDLLAKDLEQVANQISKTEGQGNGSVLSANPKTLYLSRAMGLGDQYLTWFDPPEVEVARKELSEKLKAIKENTNSTPQVLIANYPIPDAVAELVKSSGLKIVVLDSLDKQPDSDKDYMSIMQKNAAEISRAINEVP